MKNSIFTALLVLFLPSVFYSQSISGYLGQRLSIGIEANPSLRRFELDYNEDLGITESNYNNESNYFEPDFASNLDYSTSLGLNKRFGFNVDYVVTRKSSLSISYTRFKTGFSNKIYLPSSGKVYTKEEISNSSYSPYKVASPYFGLVNNTIGLEYITFLGNESSAPLGKYVSIGLHIVHSKVTDPSNLNYGSSGLFTYDGVHLTDPNHKVNTILYSFGFGKKVMLGFDRLILDYGMEFGLSSAFVSRIKADKEKNNYYEGSNLIDEDEVDSNIVYIDVDQQIYNSAKNRLLNYFSMNLHIGLNVLLF
jgi:hypothetical protein